ncbi:sensor histidine kinase [Streptacidiphilus monticola]
MTDLPSERTRLLRLTVAPAALVAVLGGAALAIQYLTASAPSAGRTTDGSSPAVGLTVIGAFAVLTVLVLALAARRARRAEREARRREETREALVRDWVAHYSAAVAAARGELREMLQQVLHGGRPEQPAAPAPVTPGDAYAALDQELRLLHHEAAMAVLHASAHQQVEVFVNIARRLQSLVTRSLQELDALEGEVEDPELLGGLLRVDHLGTRLRRHVESLAVLGGATPRRIGRPVAVYTVLRQALSEIEQYARVKILRPVEGTLKGHVVTDVIHLVAELIENATNFSRPETQVHVRAQLVAAGLAIEIDDRGLGIPLEERDRLERLLTRPDLVDLGEQLKDGRIGLFVVARLAQRHGIAVRAQSNIYGGTQAVVVIPLALLETEPAAPPAAAPVRPRSGRTSCPGVRPRRPLPRSARAAPLRGRGAARSPARPTGPARQPLRSRGRRVTPAPTRP